MAKRRMTPDEGKRALLTFVDIACGVLDGFEALEGGSSLPVAVNIAIKKSRKRMKKSGILPRSRAKTSRTSQEKRDKDDNVIDVEGKPL